ALFQAIAERHGPAMRELLFDREGQPAPSLLCFVGEEQVDWSQPPALSEGVRVMLLSPISGG
ncbi:MAG: MoaD/ThiS family protein, partial [Lentisphaerae bacterium]|nr:MoaD/ThiS family protein [Lentisphaerota bacterium]